MPFCFAKFKPLKVSTSVQSKERRITKNQSTDRSSRSWSVLGVGEQDACARCNGVTRGCVSTHVGALSTLRLCKTTRPARTGSFRRTYTSVNYHPTVRTRQVRIGRLVVLYILSLSLFIQLSFSGDIRVRSSARALCAATPGPSDFSLCSFAFSNLPHLAGVCRHRDKNEIYGLFSWFLSLSVFSILPAILARGFIKAG